MAGVPGWSDLRNPVLAYPEWSIKDACLAWDGRRFHVFFSAFSEERSTVAKVSTPDFREFSPFELHLDGRADGWIGLCSPDIVFADGQWVLTLNSWGDDPARPNQLFYCTSPDLMRWSPTRPLAENLTRGVRAIDAALARAGDRWILMYKGARWRVVRAATAPALDGPWEFIGEEAVQFLAADGRENGLTHENFCFLQVDGRWQVLTTDYSPHHAWLYTLSGSGDAPRDWLRWEHGRQLAIPGEAFNTVDRDNAAAICDWREHDGHFYLIYGGKNEERRDAFRGTASPRPWARGWNRLGLARSTDLTTWHLPGQ